MRLWLIRHADPDYARDCLTEAGKKEAAALGEYLATISLDYLFSSPLGRAQETAAIVSPLVKRPVQTLAWLAELTYGTVCAGGPAYWDIDGQVVRTADRLEAPGGPGIYPDDIAHLIEAQYQTLVEHSDRFLAELGYQRTGQVYQVQRANTWQVGLICHGALGLMWLAHLLAMPVPLMWAGFFMHPTSVSTILFAERPAGIACPRCLSLGAMPHLYHRQLPASRTGIIANYE